MDDVDDARTLRVLHLEDSPLDHDLAMAHLGRAGHHVHARRVESADELRRALAEATWDIVLSDFHLPGFDGLRALALLRGDGIDLPFVLVSGQIGEDTAVAAMRNGASDYLLKQNLSRLAPAVEHAIAAWRDRKAREAADRELAGSRERLSALAQHLQTSIETEHAAISREIHDDVGASLTALRYDLAWLGRHVGDDPALRQRIDSATETLAHAIEASKRVMLNLRPAILEQGLVPALAWQAQAFERRHGIACAFQANREAMTLPPAVPLVAYRFVQEALTNIVKHAQARRVTVDAALSRGVLSLEVSDDGRGLADGDLAKARSFGLRGLHERAQTVGGWVDVSSRPGRGTVLMLSIPVPAEAGDDVAYDDDDDELGDDTGGDGDAGLRAALASHPIHRAAGAMAGADDAASR